MVADSTEQQSKTLLCLVALKYQPKEGLQMCQEKQSTIAQIITNSSILRWIMLNTLKIHFNGSYRLIASVLSVQTNQLGRLETRLSYNRIICLIRQGASG